MGSGAGRLEASPKGIAPGRRIAVVGPSGAGKSHVARLLARRLGIPYVCNDAIIWGPNWTIVPRAERPLLFTQALAGEAWTFDGNFDGRKGKGGEDVIILDRIDTLIWLDLPRWRVMGQLLVRTFRRAMWKEELWHGNRETWRSSFASRESILVWSWQTYRRYRDLYARMFADPELADKRRIRLTSRRSLNRWLATVEEESGRGS